MRPPSAPGAPRGPEPADSGDRAGYDGRAGYPGHAAYDERAGYAGRPAHAAHDDPAVLERQEIEVVPVVVLSRAFPARPSSIPDIRDFVRSCLSRSPLGEDENRRVFETVSQALLDAAGPEGGINVSFRIFPDHVEVDVLRTDSRMDPEKPGSWPMAWADGAGGGASGASRGVGRPGVSGTAAPAGPPGTGSGPPAAPGPGMPMPVDRDADDDQPFAQWMADVMRRQGMSMETTASQLGVSVKTVGRWIGGTTEPRLRDLRRIRELFGETPLG